MPQFRSQFGHISATLQGLIASILITDSISFLAGCLLNQISQTYTIGVGADVIAVGSTLLWATPSLPLLFVGHCIAGAERAFSFLQLPRKNFFLELLEPTNQSAGIRSKLLQHQYVVPCIIHTIIRYVGYNVKRFKIYIASKELKVALSATEPCERRVYGCEDDVN